jgi:hypothetical protein
MGRAQHAGDQQLLARQVSGCTAQRDRSLIVVAKEQRRAGTPGLLAHRLRAPASDW